MDSTHTSTGAVRTTAPVTCAICAGAEHRFERVLNGFTLVRCSGCGFVHVNPQPTSEWLHEIYTVRDADAVRDLYAEIIGPSDIATYESFLDRLELLTGGPARLLDFGCGPAYLTECAQKRGWDAHGVDIGEWTLQAARARGVRNIHAGYLHEQDFGPESFDAVISLEVFEHLTTPIEQLKEIRSVLKPGGLVLLGVPNYGSLSKRLNRDGFRLNMPPQHLNFFTAHTLGALLARTGFEVLDVYSHGGLNLENIFGRRYETRTTATLDRHSSTEPITPPGDSRARPLWKRALMPVVSAVLYQRLLLGMGLVAIARKSA